MEVLVHDNTQSQAFYIPLSRPVRPHHIKGPTGEDWLEEAPGGDDQRNIRACNICLWILRRRFKYAHRGELERQSVRDRMRDEMGLPALDVDAREGDYKATGDAINYIGLRSHDDKLKQRRGAKNGRLLLDGQNAQIASDFLGTVGVEYNAPVLN